jgi:hypothetical protein
MAYLVVVMAYDFVLIPVPAESDPIPSPDPSSLAHDLSPFPTRAGCEWKNWMKEAPFC